MGEKKNEQLQKYCFIVLMIKISENNEINGNYDWNNICHLFYLNGKNAGNIQ